MLISNRERAYIPRPKPTRYLLSFSHPVGKSKALFLSRAHGFDAKKVDLLEEGLLHIAREGERLKGAARHKARRGGFDEVEWLD